jgi:2,3-bisphosphoglycerate-independent phosphoglycerate mutase
MHSTKSAGKKTCLVVIDGWGCSGQSPADADAIAAAKTPVMTGLSQKMASCQLQAHGLAVGLPEGLMGNSEVGHLNLGAGRVVFQDIVRIDLAIENGTLEAENESLCSLFDACEQGNK